MINPALVMVLPLLAKDAGRGKTEARGRSHLNGAEIGDDVVVLHGDAGSAGAGKSPTVMMPLAAFVIVLPFPPMMPAPSRPMLIAPLLVMVLPSPA